jgi:hypothetical protein
VSQLKAEIEACIISTLYITVKVQIWN